MLDVPNRADIRLWNILLILMALIHIFAYLYSCYGIEYLTMIERLYIEQGGRGSVKHINLPEDERKTYK